MLRKLVPVLTLVIAVTLSFAFRSADKVRHDCYWFEYIGTQTTFPAVIATTAQARIKTNWRFLVGQSPNCIATKFLCAICVKASEIDDGADNVVGTADDLPNVDVPANTIYQDLGDPQAIDASGFWQSVNHSDPGAPIQNHIRAKSSV